MREGPDIARIAALIGEPARASMLLALMRGGALTLSELASEAGVGLSTASAHAARLADGGLVRTRPSGRHRYMELTSPAVAALVEQLMGLSAAQTAERPGARRRSGPRDPMLRAARVCYDHLAGDCGVRMFESMVQRGFLALGEDGIALTPEGRGFMTAFGLTDDMLRPGRPPLCRECLDWSLRRSHLAGRLGRSLLAAIEGRGWMRRIEGSRALRIRPAGRTAFDLAFPSAGDPAPADESLDLPGHSA